MRSAPPWKFLVPPAEEMAPAPAPPTFTIVIAAYQAAASIAAAVASALAQTYRPLQVIVSDDGSTDDLEDALRPFQDSLVLIRSAEQRGPAAARNAALRRASGDFIAILDADDVYSPQRLEALAALASTHPGLDIVTTDAQFERDGRVTGLFYNERFLFPVEDQRSAILERCFLFAPAVRRTRLEAIEGFDEALPVASDWDCWIRLIQSGARAGLVKAPLVRYRIHEASLTANRVRSLRARVAVLEKSVADTRLNPDERRTAESALRVARRRASAAAAEQALGSGDPGIRRRALTVLGMRSIDGLMRLKAALFVLAPVTAARLSARRR